MTPKYPQRLSLTKSPSGFTMIEVLVTLFVLAVGLLGLAMLQVTGLRLNTNSYSRTQATLLAYEIIDRMRANPVGFNNGNYDVTNLTTYNTVWSTYATCKTNSCDCNTNACDTATLAVFDLGRWYERQFDPTGASGAALLPGAEAVLNGATGTAQIATIQRAAPPNADTVMVRMVWSEQDQQQSQTTTQLKTQTWVAQIRSTP